MAHRKVVVVWRHSCDHPGRLLCRYHILWMWRGDRTGLCQEMQEICREIPLAYTFLPIAMETLDSVNDSAYRFFELRILAAE